MNALPDLVSLTYEAAVGGEWSHALRAIADAARVDALGLALANDLSAGRPPVACGIAPELVAAYPRYHLEDRVWNGAMCTTPRGAVAEILPPRLLEETLVYQEWIRPQRWRDVLQVRLYVEPGARGGLLVGRCQRRSARAADPRFDVLAGVVPHLCGAIAVRHELDRAQRLAAVSERLLEVLPLAIVLVDRDARLLAASRTAEEMLAEAGSAVGLAGGRLRLATREATARLLAACARAEDAVLAVPRQGRQPLRLMATPLEAPDGRTAGADTLAVVLVDAERPALLDDGLLCTVYGLTRAQAALTALLVQGFSLADAAAALGVTVGTVRDRLKQVFARTGTRRQSDLVRLVLSGPMVFGRAPRPGTHAVGLRLADGLSGETPALAERVPPSD
jgi:DNA-binding CsgD family transcriptional regulator